MKKSFARFMAAALLLTLVSAAPAALGDGKKAFDVIAYIGESYIWSMPSITVSVTDGKLSGSCTLTVTDMLLEQGHGVRVTASSENGDFTLRYGTAAIPYTLTLNGCTPAEGCVVTPDANGCADIIVSVYKKGIGNVAGTFKDTVTFTTATVDLDEP